MTTRRNFLIIAGAGTALTLTGCDVRANPTSGNAGRPAGPPDILVVDTIGGLAAVRDGRIHVHSRAVISPDGETIYATTSAGVDTDLLTIATKSGQTTAMTRLRGMWVPGVVGVSSTTVALVAPADNPYAPGRHGRTTMLMVTRGADPLLLDLAGNYAPDAFTIDNSGIFVLDWLPATAPDHYRVREIDFATRVPTALLTRDKTVIPPGAEENMRGRRRNAVFGSGNEVLYSLYTNQPGVSQPTDADRWPGADTAFIHTLQLAQHWAYCVDLPMPFGLGPNAGHALTVGPDGDKLYVADVSGGRLAVINTDALTVETTVKLSARDGDAYAAATTDTLFVAAGKQVQAIDRTSMMVRATWSLPDDVLGLGRSADGARLYVGLPDAVHWRDARTGAALGEARLPGLTGIQTVL